MTDIVIPSGLRVARSSFKYIDQTGVSRGVFSGAIQSTAYGGDRIGASLDFTPAGGASTADRSLRAQIKATLMSTRGKQNRIFAEDNSTTRRGSFASTEMFANTDFSSGWTADQGGVLTAPDGIGRLSVSGVGSNPEVYRSVSMTAYTAYALRTLYVDGAQMSALSAGPSLTLSGSAAVASYSVGGGYKIAAGVALSTSSLSQFALVISTTSGYSAGTYASILFTSLSACALNAACGNLFTQSDTLGSADWSKTELTVGSNVATDPYGTNTADLLTPSTNNATHFQLQTKAVAAAVDDFMVCGYFRAGGYNFIRLQMNENTSATSVYQIFNLNTGALGATNSTGANWSNLRSAIVSMGGGWYYCAIIARKTNAATSLSGLLVVSNADSAATFAGNGTSGVYGSRATMFTSQAFDRPVLSTTVAVAASTPSGTSIYLKCLLASQTGLLVVGDWVEIDGQIKMVTASLDSDAAGIGHLQFSPPLRRAIADNTPIIVNRPMGRFILAGDAMWNNVPGVFSDASIELEEAWS